MTAKVFIKSRKARPFWFGDPWIFEGSVDRIKGKGRLEDGDVVEVHDHEGKRIGSGFYNSRSKIVVRLAATGEELIDAEWLRKRLRRAIELRRDILHLEESADVYRLVHAEGDGLPGLIVDRLADWLVVHFDVLGMRRFRDLIADELLAATGAKGVYERVSRVAREQEGMAGEDGPLRGTPPEAPIEVSENGLRYTVDIRLGQKSGFYSDQRENRLALAAFSAGRTVLDCFSYIGAFGLVLLHHGQAAHVTAVDSSRPALDALIETARRNGLSPSISVEHANVLRYLDHLRKDATKRFGVVVLDPPKLVPKMADLRRGLKLYHEINVKGLTAVEDGGILATCSCSGLVSEDDFSQMVIEAAHDAGVRLQLLHRGGQGPDHPVLLPHMESRYLKFHVYRVHRVPTVPMVSPSNSPEVPVE